MRTTSTSTGTAKPSGATTTSTGAHAAGGTSTPAHAGNSGGSTVAAKPNGAAAASSGAHGSGGSTSTSSYAGKSFGNGSSTPTSKSFGNGHASSGSGTTGHGGYAEFRSRSVPPGGREMHTSNGGHVTFDHAGNPRDIQARGMDIRHGPGDGRVIVAERPGHVVVVSNRYGHGYISHPYTYHNVEFVHRTYYVNGVVYSRYYRPWTWHGLALHVYAPGAYFAPAYYGWAYHPWAVPVVYGGWGWAARPWYGYYRGWFSPYPRYAGPAFWLTDYLVAQTLMATYQERAAELAAARMSYEEPLSPAVKDLIAAEVQRQLALANSEAVAGAAQPPPIPARAASRACSPTASRISSW